MVAAKEWVAAQDKIERRSPEARKVTEVQVRKVTRSDAAWSEANRTAGLGWVVLSQEQNSRGQRGTDFVTSVTIAEELALREAMLSCQQLGVKEVRFESDSQHLIKAINNREPSMELYGIV